MLLEFYQVIVLAILQGVTELFPVSSLGHAVIVPGLLIWPIDAKGPGLVPFLVILHLGTAAALLAFYWRDWLKLLLALVGAGNAADRPVQRKLIVLLIVGTIPAAIAGALFNHALKEGFAVPGIAAIFLIVNGVILFLGDRKRRLQTAGLGSAEGKPIEDITVLDALIIGVTQIAALIPGISRSGVTIIAGLRRKLAPDAAAHFSFLLATPIILGAGVLEVPKLLKGIHNGHVDAQYLHYSLIGGVVAGIFAFISVAMLTRYFRVSEVKVMRPFAFYCLLLGIVSLAVFASRGM
jgi:undecaprenyl-diphosphatase